MNNQFYYPDIGSENISFKDHTLIWPALTIGNVGQLTVDLLISTLDCKRIGYIVDENIVPIIGNDTYTPIGTGLLSTSIEVYQPKLNPSKITLVQQRAPVIQGQIHKFSEHIINWFKSSGFKDLLFLASTNANKRIDSQLSGNQIRFVKSQTVDNYSIERLKLSSIVEMETIGNSSNDHVTSDYSGNITIAEPIKLSNRLTGVGKELLQLSNENSINFVSLVLFCSEGDNTNDATQVTKFVFNLLNLSDNNDVINFNFPQSWSLLQGPTYDQALYF